MRRRVIRLSQADQAKIYGLRVAANTSYREIEKVIGIPKSTVHYNMAAIRNQLEKDKDPYSGIKQLVYFVLTSVFVGKSPARCVADMTSLLFVNGVSHPTVLKILDCAAEVARELNSDIDFGHLDVAVFDEIFKKKWPILAMADPISGLVYLEATDDRSRDSWEKMLETLKAQGLNPETVNTDGGHGLLAALQKVFPKTLVMRDLFHVLYKLSKALRIMEAKCYRLILNVDTLRRNEATEQALVNAEQGCTQAIEIFDKLEKLYDSLRKASYLQHEAGVGEYVNSDQQGLILSELVENLQHFMRICSHRAVKEAMTYLKNSKQSITAYKRHIEQKAVEQFGEIYAKHYLEYFMQLVEIMDQYKKSYESKSRQEFWGKKAAQLIAKSKLLIGEKETTLAIAQAIEIFKTAVKSNSYIEAVNSVIRPYLDSHKSIPRWLCPILTVYWNNRVPKRGKRKGSSPLDHLTLADVFQKSESKWIDLIMERFPFEKFTSGIDLSEMNRAA